MATYKKTRDYFKTTDVDKLIQKANDAPTKAHAKKQLPKIPLWLKIFKEKGYSYTDIAQYLINFGIPEEKDLHHES